MGNVRNPYKERLKKIIGKKFQTTTIYPLSQFEMAFGHIWGMGKTTPLTQEEKINKQKWANIRDSILNMGNTQRRNCFAELDQHDITWLKYSSVFIPVDNNINKED